MNAYKITYKMEQKSRRLHTAVQFHNDINDAAVHGMAIIKDYYPDAILVDVFEIKDPRELK